MCTPYILSISIYRHYVARKKILTGKWHLFRSCVISLSEVVWAGMRVWEDSKCITASLYSYIFRYRSSSVCNNRVWCWPMGFGETQQKVFGNLKSIRKDTLGHLFKLTSLFGTSSSLILHKTCMQCCLFSYYTYYEQEVLNTNLKYIPYINLYWVPNDWFFRRQSHDSTWSCDHEESAI